MFLFNYQLLNYLAFYVLNLFVRFCGELKEMFDESHTITYKIGLWYLFFFSNVFLIVLICYALGEVLALIATLGTVLSIVYYVLLEQMAGLV